MRLATYILQVRKLRQREIKIACRGSTDGESKSKLNVKCLPGSQTLAITFNLTDNRNKFLIETNSMVQAREALYCNDIKHLLSVF